MGEFKIKDSIKAWTFVIILGHAIGYYNDYLGLDELIPCVLGYLAIAAILLSSISDEEKSTTEVAEEPVSAKVLICNNCKRFYLAPTDFCTSCNSTTLTETHPSNIQFITTKSNQNEK